MHPYIATPTYPHTTTIVPYLTNTGSLLFNPLNAWILTSYGWRVAFRLAGFMVLITGLPCCWAFISKQEVCVKRMIENNDDSEDESVLNSTLKGLLRSSWRLVKLHALSIQIIGYINR